MKISIDSQSILITQQSDLQILYNVRNGINYSFLKKLFQDYTSEKLRKKRKFRHFYGMSH